MQTENEDQIDSIKANLKILPNLAGVYLMKDEDETVIYVGKAKNLRARIRSYFHGADDRYQVKFLLKKVSSLKTIVTDTEEQAFILERDLINKLKPRYNIRLKDDKNYLSVRIDESAPWPKLELVRKVEQDSAKYFGPYSFSYELRELLELINKTLPLRTCSDTVFYNRQRPCIEYQIKRCAGPCCLDVDPQEYHSWVKEACAILGGNITSLVQKLEKKMELAAENLHYEEAADARDKIEILKKFKKGQKYISQGTEDRDVFALYRDESLAVVSLLLVRNGRIADNKNFSFENVDLPNEEIIEAVLEQYYLKASEFPKEIVVSELLADNSFLQNLFKEKVSTKIEILKPQKGLKFRLVNLALLNAKQHFELTFDYDSRIQELVKNMSKTFKLKQIPRRIECIDISNLQGSDIVGAVVSFFDGKADKKNYKKFKISFKDKPNDFEAIKEVVIKHIQKANQNDTLPDLLIIDGGKTQLDYAVQALDHLGVSLDIIALAKERKVLNQKELETKPERVFLVGSNQAISLDPSNSLTHFIARIRDEVHRFVITYHRSKRSKRVIRSVLDEIPGIGPERRKRLLKKYKSVENMKSVDARELARTGRMSVRLAEKLLEMIGVQ